MVIRQIRAFYMIMLIAAVFFSAGCEMVIGRKEGGLLLQFADPYGQLTEERTIDWEPEAAQRAAAYYTVKLTDPDGNVYLEERYENSSDLSVLIEPLPAGTWAIEAAGYSDSGEMVTALAGTGSLEVSVFRSQTAEVVLPLSYPAGESGSLQVFLDWSALKITEQLEVNIQLEPVTGERSGRGSSYAVTDSSGELGVTLEGLEPGLYQVSLDIKDLEGTYNDLSYWEGTYTAALIPGTVTRGSAVINEFVFGYGDMLLRLEQALHPLELSLTRDSFPVIGSSAEVTFSGEEAGEAAELYWYVNGELVQRGGSRLTYHFVESGRYRIVLAALDTVKEEAAAGQAVMDLQVFEQLPKVGETGPAGGQILYAKESFSDGWQFIETAPGFLLNEGSELFTWEEAASSCAALRVEGLAGWELPAAEELTAIYGASVRLGLGLFSGKTVWSADAVLQDNAEALALDWDSGELVSLDTALSRRSVLPVRRF